MSFAKSRVKIKNDNNRINNNVKGNVSSKETIENERILANWSFQIVEIMNIYMKQNNSSPLILKSEITSILELSLVQLIMPYSGDAYDSFYHDPIRFIPGDKPNKIVELIENGFSWNGDVVRRAKVVVSA